MRQELSTDINIPRLGLHTAVFSLIFSLLKLPYLLLCVNNKGLLSILTLSLPRPLVKPFYPMLSSLLSHSLREKLN